MIDDADRRRQRCNVVAIPAQRKELVLSAQFVRQFVEAIARMLDHVRPELTSESLDFGHPVGQRMADLIVFEEQPQQVRVRLGGPAQHRKEILFGAVPRNEIPVMIDEVCGIRIERIDKAPVAGIRARLRRHWRLMYASQVEQMTSLGCVQAKSARQALEYFGRDSVGAALFETGQPRDTHPGKHGYFFTSKTRGSAIRAAVQSNRRRVEALAARTQELPQLNRFHHSSMAIERLSCASWS